MNGLLVLDKPGGLTSREALDRVKRWFPKRTKIGHTGTLDPLATGVLVVCVGAATRLADHVQAMGKSYDSRFRLGATSTTDDADGEIRVDESATAPSRERIETALAEFIGLVEQMPPAFSALKVGGRRAHDLARKGDVVPLAARPVALHSIRVLRYEWPYLEVAIDCGKGTYIRSIARDLGEKLGVGGFVEMLRRTRVGPFTPARGVTIDATREEVHAKLLPLMAALGDIPQVRITAEQEVKLRQGQTIPSEQAAGEVAILNERGGLIAIADANRGLHPRIVLAHESCSIESPQKLASVSSEVSQNSPGP